MKKKIIFGLSSILLFMLLLGSFGSTYAWSYNEVKGTIENVITNSGYNNVYLTNLNTWVHNEVAEEFQPIFSSYDNFIIMCNYATLSDNMSYLNSNIIIYAWDDPDTTYNIYEYKSGSNWMLRTTTNITRVRFAGDNDTYWNNGQYYHQTESTSNNNLGFGNRNNPPLWVIFTNKSVLASASGGTATQNWNTYMKHIPMVWNFTANGSTVSILDGNMSYFHTIDSIYNCPLGVLKDSIYARKITYNWGTWNGRSYNWGRDYVLYDYNKNGYLPNYFVGSTTNENDINSTRIDINANNHGNDILALTIESDNSSTRGTIITFYLVTNNYSNIVNGVFYPGNTFSGDYNNQYNQQQNTNNIIGSSEENTQEIKDTITDDSKVDSMLDETLSGDKILQDIGFNFVVNPFEDIIKNTLIGFTNALLGSGNETLTFKIYNHTYALHSEEFTLPDGELKSFITLLCNAFVVYSICKYGFQLYEWINTGRIQNLVNEQNRHQYYLF